MIARRITNSRPPIKLEGRIALNPFGYGDGQPYCETVGEVDLNPFGF